MTCVTLCKTSSKKDVSPFKNGVRACLFAGGPRCKKTQRGAFLKINIIKAKGLEGVTDQITDATCRQALVCEVYLVLECTEHGARNHVQRRQLHLISLTLWLKTLISLLNKWGPQNISKEPNFLEGIAEKFPRNLSRHITFGETTCAFETGDGDHQAS